MNHAVARHQSLHRAAHFHDDAGSFVTHDPREVCIAAELAVAPGDIAVADATGLDSDSHLVGASDAWRANVPQFNAPGAIK